MLAADAKKMNKKLYATLMAPELVDEEQALATPLLADFFALDWISKNPSELLLMNGE